MKNHSLSRYPSTNHNITASGVSQKTSAFGEQTRTVRITGTGAFYWKLDEEASVTATASDPVMVTGAVDYISVRPGQAIAVLQLDTAPVVSITEMTS